MNQNELEKYIGQFDEYLEGRLDQIDHSALRSALEEDPNLRKELELHVEARAEIRSAGEKAQKKYFMTKLQDTPTKATDAKVKSKRPLWIAIGILYLIAFILFLFFKLDRGSDMITTPREPIAYLEDPSPQLLRSSFKKSNVTWDKAVAAYVDKDYKTALEFFDALSKDDAFVIKHGGKLNLYNGIVCTRLEAYDKAISLFQSIPERNPFYDQAQWYEALAYLISGKKDKAVSSFKRLVATENHYKKDDAMSILESIQ